MNPLYEKTITGTMGELLVQIRLLQYSVQAAFPLKDSGNDLIAVRGNVFRAVQVRTTIITSGRAARCRYPRRNSEYHIFADVRLYYENDEYQLDKSEIYLFSKEAVDDRGRRRLDRKSNRISQELIDVFFRGDTH